MFSAIGLPIRVFKLDAESSNLRALETRGATELSVFEIRIALNGYGDPWGYKPTDSAICLTIYYVGLRYSPDELFERLLH